VLLLHEEELKDDEGWTSAPSLKRKHKPTPNMMIPPPVSSPQRDRDTTVHMNIRKMTPLPHVSKLNMRSNLMKESHKPISLSGRPNGLEQSKKASQQDCTNTTRISKLPNKRNLQTSLSLQTVITEMVFDRNSNGDNTTDPEVTVLVTDKTTERSQLISPIFSSSALNHASTIYLVLWYHHD